MTESGDPHPAAARGLAVAVLAACTALLTACTAEARPAGTASPFGGCATLTAPPASAPATVAKDNTLPPVELPCFTGGDAVKLTQVRGPAVINVWASWCEPCRTELPAMQQLADRAKGKLTVLGVNTGDDRDAAASFGADHRIGMPMLYDRDRTLIGRLGRTALPVTIFLGADGSPHVESLPLDETKLDELVRAWTGVTVKR